MMLTGMRRYLGLGGLLAVVMASAGCFAVLVGAAAGAGGYAWVKGALVKEFNVSAAELHAAAAKGVGDLGLVVLDDRADRLTGYIRADFADGTHAKINIRALTELSSEMRIRVGLLGDKNQSEMILNAVRENL